MKRMSYGLYRLYYRLKVYIVRRFTRAGVFLLILLVFAAILGVETKLSMVFQVFTFIVFLLLIAFLLSLRMRGNFDFQRHLPRFATAGMPFQYNISIHNHSGKRYDKLTLIEEFAVTSLTYREFLQLKPFSPFFKASRHRKPGLSRWPDLLVRKQGAPIEPQKRVDLQPNEVKDLRLEMLPLRRGRIRLSGISVAHPDPLGICYARHFKQVQQSILVLPKRYSIPPIQMPGGRKHHSGGIALTTSVGESEEFVSLREYRPGDPLRKFHWKSWAKIGKPIVREYQEEFFVRHVLILDTFVSENQTEAFEEAVSLAASFACTVQTQESLLDLIFVGLEVYCFTAGRGLGQTDKILEVLADVQPCDTQPFDALFPTVMSKATFCSGSICIFASWDEERQKLVQLLQQLDIPVFVFVILQPDDTTKPDPGPLSDVADNFHVLRAGEIDMGLAQI